MRLKFYSKDWSVLPEKDVKCADLLESDKGVIALRQYLVSLGANLRQGNACTKDRGEVSGTGKKPYRQKGTGRARHGSQRSPIWAGGGVVFGPKPRDYSQKLNKKIKTLALARALSDKIATGEFSIVSEFFTEQPKTKEVARLINSIASNKSALLVSDAFSENFVLSTRNIPNVFIIDVRSVNAYDIVRHRNVIVSENALEILLKRAELEPKE